CAPLVAIGNETEVAFEAKLSDARSGPPRREVSDELPSLSGRSHRIADAIWLSPSIGRTKQLCLASNDAECA
ncbi:MAG: hypothetical protein WBP94_19040, partial [Rhodomicrobiaceae bacterium]